MSRKVVHEHKIPKPITVVLYAIALALTLNLAKPFMDVSPAAAGYHSNLESSVTMLNSILLRIENRIDDIEDKIDDIDDNMESVWSAVLDIGYTLDSVESTVESLDSY